MSAAADQFKAAAAIRFVNIYVNKYDPNESRKIVKKKRAKMQDYFNTSMTGKDKWEARRRLLWNNALMSRYTAYGL